MRRIFYCTLLWCLLLATRLQAYEVRPLVHYLDVSTGAVTSAIQVRNTGTQPLPVEFSSYRLLMREGSPYAGARADEQLLVFPPASLIEPGATQVVRVQWASQAFPQEDQSFLVVISQVPDQRQTDGVQMLLMFNAVVHLKAAGSQPSLQIGDRALDSGSEDLPSLKFDLNNSGSGNAYGRDITLLVSWPQGRREFSSVELAEYAPDLFLPPGSKRTVELPLPALPVDTSASDINIDVRYQ